MKAGWRATLVVSLVGRVAAGAVGSAVLAVAAVGWPVPTMAASPSLRSSASAASPGACGTGDRPLAQRALSDLAEAAGSGWPASLDRRPPLRTRVASAPDGVLEVVEYWGDIGGTRVRIRLRYRPAGEGGSACRQVGEETMIWSGPA